MPGGGPVSATAEEVSTPTIEFPPYVNPLTGLPGNGPINDETERLLRSGARFVVAHVDLDDFKPFNDAYGYAHGDQVLLHVAQLLREAGAPRSDFIGHLGGDDFVLLLRSPDWQNRLRWAVTEFARSVAGFYSPEHRRAGFLETTDRYGALTEATDGSMKLPALFCNFTKGIF